MINIALVLIFNYFIMNSIKILVTWFVNGCFINMKQSNGIEYFEVRCPSGISLDFDRRCDAFRFAENY